MKMIDALYPNSIPQGTSCDIIAAYIDHSSNPHSYDQAVTRFPKAIHLKISTRGTVGAHVLDYEHSTVIGKQPPSACVTWVLESRKAGIDPTIYCNQMDPDKGWSAIKAAFDHANVPQPHYWVAKYDGNPAIPAGAVAKQFTDLDQHGVNTYDTSSTISSWPTMEDDVTPEELTAIIGDEKVSTQRVGDAVHQEADATRKAVMGASNVDNTRLGQVLHANTDGLVKIVTSLSAQVSALVALLSHSGSLDAAQAKSIALEAAKEAVDGITVTVQVPESSE